MQSPWIESNTYLCLIRITLKIGVDAIQVHSLDVQCCNKIQGWRGVNWLKNKQQKIEDIRCFLLFRSGQSYDQQCVVKFKKLCITNSLMLSLHWLRFATKSTVSVITFRLQIQFQNKHHRLRKRQYI